MHLLKTMLKCCICHTNRFLTRGETRRNVIKCHACHAKRGYAMFETSKSDRYLQATLPRTSLALANYLLATLTTLAYNRVGWGARWGVGWWIPTCHMEKIKKGSYLAYPSLSKTYQLKHEEVNHAAGEFVRLKRRGPQPALSVHSVHTGGIDCIRKKTQKISFHRAFTTERKAKSTNINKHSKDCVPQTTAKKLKQQAKM